MIPPCHRRPCSGLSILESLTLLFTCSLLLLIGVPVALMRLGIWEAPIEDGAPPPPARTTGPVVTPVPHTPAPRLPALPGFTDLTPPPEKPKDASPELAPPAKAADSPSQPPSNPPPSSQPPAAPPPFKPIPLSEGAKP